MSGATVLVADDDAAVRTVVGRALRRSGYETRETDSAATLWSWIEAGEGDLVITDVVMPSGNGLDLLPRVGEARPGLPVIVVSARNTMLTALRASEGGAFEYFPKPFDLDALVDAAGRALAAARGPAGDAQAPSAEDLPLVGRSPAMQRVYRVLARVVNTDLTVMVLGESGTGKELVARALHDFSPRAREPFVAVNMAAIPRELIESELFGHERGAFTGAHRRTQGRFAQADRGTLFLDEIGDMPPEAQTRLLRVLQEGEFSPVGGAEAQRVDVRIVAATHRDLGAMVNEGLFREDLYYRLNVVPLRMPPLRERLEDLPLLVSHLLARAADEGMPGKGIDPDAVARLERHAWPGNVRELENLLRRLLVLTAGDTIGLEAVEEELAEAGPPAAGGGAPDSLEAGVDQYLARYFAAHGDSLPLPGLHARVLREVERPLVLRALAATGGNQLRAAALLGINRNTLRKKIRDLDIHALPRRRRGGGGA